MRADVYHALTTRTASGGAAPLAHVAMIDLDACDTVRATLDRVYALAQRGVWAAHAQVIWVADEDLRSTAPGDVIVLDGSAAYAVSGGSDDDGTSGGYRRALVPIASQSLEAP